MGVLVYTLSAIHRKEMDVTSDSVIVMDNILGMFIIIIIINTYEQHEAEIQHFVT